MRRLFYILTIAIVCGLCATHGNAQVLNTKLKKHTIRTVLVLPPRVSLIKYGITGAQGMAEEEGKAADALYVVVRNELELRGVTVLPNPSNRELSDEAKYMFANAQAKYDSVKAQLRRHPGDVKKGRFTIGDLLAAYPPADGVELVVFVHGSGVVLTAGKQAFGLIVGGPKASMFGGNLTFIDPKSGEVLAYSSFSVDGYYSAESLRPNLRESMRKLPLPNSADLATAMYESSRNAK
jgi:hypothetical protein